MPGRMTFLLALVVSLLVAAPAFADTYTVAGTGDPAGAVCHGLSCDSLRAAVTAATNTKPADVIALGQATYLLEQAQPLALTGNLTITGLSPRKTVVQGGSSARVMTVTGTANDLTLLTVAGGRAGTAPGGNILNSGGTLTLDHVRVTDGSAGSGGAIYNDGGRLTILE